MEQSIQIVKKTTLTLNDALSAMDASPEKMSVILNIYDNLQFLKNNITLKEYEEEFDKIQNRVQKYFDKLTEPNFVKNFAKLVEKLLKA
jgi:hypothetical protein